MKSSDLTSDMKKALLENIKKNLGDYEYRKTVNSLGEDGIVDMFLQNLPKQTAQKEEVVKKSSSFWGSVGAVIGWIIENCWFIIIMAVAGEKIGGIIIAVIFGIIILIAIYENRAKMGEFLAIVVAIAIAVGIIALIGYCLWKGLPWMWQGVTDYWGWLGNKFT